MSEHHDIHAPLHRNSVTMDNNQYLKRAVFLPSKADWFLYTPRVATLKSPDFVHKMCFLSFVCV